jgi:L-ribulokinase
MGGRTRNAYTPIVDNVARYDQLYAEYVKLHDWFGRGNAIMRTLREISTPARAGASR